MEAGMIQAKQSIENGRTALGIEFGSTRIKAVLTDEAGSVLAVGIHDWENSLKDGFWTYSLEEIHAGLEGCYADLKHNTAEKYGTALTRIGAIGISAMMHGYLAFDRNGKLLVPFRTWRNTTTEAAADRLTKLFSFNIPQRWSIAHLDQAALNREPHVPQIASITTLAGYIHRCLTGRNVLGVGDASGMFPIDPETKQYDRRMLDLLETLPEIAEQPWKAEELLPEVLCAGEEAGRLTEKGALLLDPDGTLQPGIPFCPPEGDAGTGMTATNSIAPRTGNVSAGTSIFAMIVLDKKLSGLHREIDMVTTPVGDTAAMAHANNGTSELNAWVSLFGEFAAMNGIRLDPNELYGSLYRKALEGRTDCGGLLSYGYYSGESITGVEEGRPMFVRMPDAAFSLANFMRMNLYSALGALKIGLDILLREENVKVDRVMGHGGLFKTEGVGQKLLAAAVDAPVTVMKTAGEGGPWGMALLAAYSIFRRPGESLADYLNQRIFAGMEGTTTAPEEEDVRGFDAFMKQYRAGLPLERSAAGYLHS